jgi:uncharacterized protein (UPF0305 family)
MWNLRNEIVGFSITDIWKSRVVVLRYIGIVLWQYSFIKKIMTILIARITTTKGGVITC